MNKTRKRALLSAFAMLLVSSLVLSSATFAWFVAGDNANINTISANVATSSSIQVSADNVNWTAQLQQADMDGLYDNSFPTMLKAMSTPAVAPMVFYNGDLLNTKAFTSSSAGAADIAANLVKFTFWIRSGEDAAVRFTTSKLEGTAAVATYVAMQVSDSAQDNAANKTPTVYVGTANSYFPINGVNTGTDLDGNAIMNDAEFPALGAQVVGTLFTSASDINLTAMEAKQITIYMWLEGQDANCKLGTSGVSGSAQLSLNFAKV
ncbi:MAG: hypothetical protein ACOYJX_00215 [Acutalibacteraceae bacterium]|jgi:hypothetical protein